MDAEKSDAEPAAPHDVQGIGTAALRALAHPLRVKIYDILSQYGPHTATMLAEKLGESSGSTSYHLRALAKHNLIEEVAGKGSGRERWWQRPRGAVTLTTPEAMRTPAGRAATQIVVTEFYRRRHEQLERYLHTAMNQDPDTWEAMLSTATMRLTAQQQEELSERLQQIIDETVVKYRDQEGEGVRPVSVRADIFPLPPEGA